MSELPAIGAVQLQDGSATLYEQILADKGTSYDCVVSYFQYGLEDSLKAGVLNSLLHQYMAATFIDALKGGQGYTKVAMRESRHRDCLGMWFMAMSDKACAESMNNTINEHLTVVRA